MALDATAGIAAPAQTPLAAGNTPGNGNNNGKPSSSAAVAQANQQLNISILQSSLSVSLSTGNSSLTLVYKSTIVSLNETLKPTLGDNALPTAPSQDNSPEGTAGRIVSLATNLFDLYKQNFPGEDQNQVLDRFLKVIQSGVDTGFGEARDVLKGLGVLSGSISDNIDKTYSLITQGFADFAAATKAQIAANTSSASTNAGSDATDTGTDNTATPPKTQVE